MFSARRKYAPTMDLSNLWHVFAKQLHDTLVTIGADEPLATKVLATLREVYETTVKETPAVDLKYPAKCSACVERIIEDLSDRNMRVCVALLLQIARMEIALLRATH